MFVFELLSGQRRIEPVEAREVGKGGVGSVREEYVLEELASEVRG